MSVRLLFLDMRFPCKATSVANDGPNKASEHGDCSRYGVLRTRLRCAQAKNEMAPQDAALLSSEVRHRILRKRAMSVRDWEINLGRTTGGTFNASRALLSAST